MKPKTQSDDPRFYFKPFERPPIWPWHTGEDRDVVWDRPLSDNLLRTFQEIAVCFDKWIKPLVDCGPEAQLLVASSLSWRRLGDFLDSVVGTILQASEQKKKPLGPIKRKRSSKVSTEDARVGLLTILDGIQSLSEFVTKEEGWRPFAMDSDPEGVHEFGSTNWSADDPIEHSLVARALGPDWERVRLSLRRLPHEYVLRSRLTSGLKLATKALLKASKKVVGNGDAKAPERSAYRQAVEELRRLASTEGSEEWAGGWCAATNRVHSAGRAWRDARWAGGLGHGENQSLRLQMFKPEAVVRQYALLMVGAGRRYRAVVLLSVLAVLFGAAKRHANTLIGRLPDRHQFRVRSVFDVDVIEPATRERWANEMSCSRAKAQQLIRTVVSAGQEEPWTLQEHFTQLVKKSLVGGTSEATQKRRIVAELLAPMQAVGLAAQLPWGELLKVESSASAGTLSLSTYRGKAWVVNPFGVRLRGG